MQGDSAEGGFKSFALHRSQLSPNANPDANVPGLPSLTGNIRVCEGPTTPARGCSVPAPEPTCTTTTLVCHYRQSATIAAASQHV